LNPPCLGEHTEALLSELGYTAAQIETLINVKSSYVFDKK
jgi:crotonobetainyl-CoA:carnitine CoA-transferase CaiB-like acyl-CoA transferase